MIDSMKNALTRNLKKKKKVHEEIKKAHLTNMKFAI